MFPSRFFSIIDSGADSCVFPATIGAQMGINVNSGKPEGTVGVVGGGIVYYHPVKVYVDIQGNSYRFDCYAGFLDGLD